jgi:hypothetical protein
MFLVICQPATHHVTVLPPPVKYIYPKDPTFVASVGIVNS